jgi:hypothetical protein
MVLYPTYTFMKLNLPFILLITVLISCNNDKNNVEQRPAIEGTWQLYSGTIVEKGDTTITDYTKNASMIKIINATHFSFLNHDLKKGKDSTSVFVAGGGRYTLTGNQYKESLEYCSAREWEGNDFEFTVNVKNDTLIQTGIEKVADLGIERLNIEKYVRFKE